MTIMETTVSQNRTDVQALMDRAAIHDVLVRYFQGIDSNRPEQVRTCFTEDIQAHYDGRPSSRGMDALMDSFLAFKKRDAGEWKVTTHFMGNFRINSLEDDVAETETYAFAFIVLTDQPKERVTMRSLRYLDKLRRTEKGWLISERQHTLDWSCEVPTQFAITMAQRVSPA